MANRGNIAFVQLSAIRASPFEIPEARVEVAGPRDLPRSRAHGNRVRPTSALKSAIDFRPP